MSIFRKSDQDPSLSPRNRNLLRSGAIAFGGSVILAVLLSHHAPTEVENFSNPAKIAQYEKQGFPVPVYQEEVQESDRTIPEMMDRLHIKPEERANASQELTAQTGKFLNPGEDKPYIPVSQVEQ